MDPETGQEFEYSTNTLGLQPKHIVLVTRLVELHSGAGRSSSVEDGG